MESTFNTSTTPSGGSKAELYKADEQRRADNEQRAASGEKTVGGEAGRAQVGSKDPSEFDTSGGPGSMGNKPVQDPVL